jgi:hypothetical protein
MQPRDKDQLKDPTTPPPPAPLSSIRVDPVLQIRRSAAQPTTPLDRLALAFANREDVNPVPIALAEFDLARNRRFVRLDPSSLRESWFRLSLPHAPSTSPATDLPSVLAVAPTDDAGTLGRPESLDRLSDPFRASLPPTPPPGRSSGSTTSARPYVAIAWRPDSLLMIETDGSHLPGTHPSRTVIMEYGFLGPGVMLQQTALSADKAGLVLFAAATLIPPRFDAPPGPNPQPVSLAVSPYLGLGFTAEESPQESEDWLLAVSELIVFDARRRGIASIESRFWHPPKAPENSPDAYALIRAWARDVWSRFAVDSPIAVVRLREIYPGNGTPRAQIHFVRRLTVKR